MKKYLCIIVLALMTAVGCGGPKEDLPELGKVFGTITIDGKPAAGITMMSYPENSKVPSYCASDQNGNYKFLYKKGVEGALLGKHTVKFQMPTLQLSGDDQYDGPPVVNPGGDIEAKQVKPGEIEVKAGDNEIHFKG